CVSAVFGYCGRSAVFRVELYILEGPHQGCGALRAADRFFRSAAQVRSAIEATVAENALRLAREQPPRKPFYLVGRLGDRDLAIAASGAGLKVRVGNEETTIPLGKEAGDEETRRIAGARAAQAPPAAAHAAVAGELSGARCDGAQPLPDGALGALGGETGDRGDPGGEDLARDLLPDGDAGAEGDARGAQSAR